MNGDPVNSKICIEYQINEQIYSSRFWNWSWFTPDYYYFGAQLSTYPRPYDIKEFLAKKRNMYLKIQQK